MELILTRTKYGETTTLGELVIVEPNEQPEHFAYTCEDTDRGLLQTEPASEVMKKKIHGKTAIPKGRYEVAMTWSNKYGKIMPQVLDVPAYQGIRIHSGNTAADTEGCILVGETIVNDNTIGNSRVVFQRLYGLLTEACQKGKVYITIK